MSEYDWDPNDFFVRVKEGITHDAFVMMRDRRSGEYIEIDLVNWEVDEVAYLDLTDYVVYIEHNADYARPGDYYPITPRARQLAQEMVATLRGRRKSLSDFLREVFKQ